MVGLKLRERLRSETGEGGMQKTKSERTDSEARKGIRRYEECLKLGG